MQRSVESILDALKRDELPYFIDAEIELNGRYAGVTPLHVFAIRGDLEACRTLLEAGAEVDVPAEHGFTALHEAVNQGHGEVVALLLNHGADPKLETELGNAFVLAGRRPDILKVLNDCTHSTTEP